MANAITRVEKGGLQKISKEIKTLHRRVDHVTQLFNERMARAQADYKEGLRRAVCGLDDPIEPSDADQETPAVATVN